MSLVNYYRYGFNGKEMDNDMSGGTTGATYDYGFRIYDSRIGKFLSVDPLTKDYPSWSPYPFAMNRPIDGIDLDGLEWESSKDKQGNINNISVNVRLNSKDANGINLEPYKNAISGLLNETLKTVSGGKISGSVTFNGGKTNGQVIPELTMYDGGIDNNIGGTQGWAATTMNLRNADGAQATPEDGARKALHELLHSVRLEHPFSVTQGADTKLIHDNGKNYLTTMTTDFNILYNIMNYSITKIDGTSYEDMQAIWSISKPTQKQTLLTKDQLNVLIKEINLQKQGYGIMPQWKKGLSTEQLKKQADEYYNDYWYKPNGTEVPKKK